MQLIFATNNLHKLEEISAIVPDNFIVKSLKEIEFKGDIPEPFHTLKENALGKAQYIFERYNFPCFADDTGLEIDALDGRPGVFSARYAGENCTPAENVIKVLKELDGISNRTACFKTVIAFTDGKNNYTFEGQIQGKIAEEPIGNKGFGYDPVFIPEGYKKTFAQLDSEIKNSISHRALATKKFIYFLKSY